MPSDVKLDGETVLVEGNWTQLRTLDLALDAPSRRISQNGQRRALVHDFGDRLTINYAGDYPNGVLITGSTHLERLYVDHSGGFAGGIVTPSILIGHPSPPPVVTADNQPQGGGQWGLDVGGAIAQLQQELAALQARVAVLEAGSP